jgi:hypothetical protein
MYALLAMMAAAQAALAAEKKALRKEVLCTGPDGKPVCYYALRDLVLGKDCLVKDPPAEGEDLREVRSVDRFGNPLGAKILKYREGLFEVIKQHERKFAATESAYKVVIDLLETQIREAQGAEAECDKFYEDMERKLDPEGAAARDAEDKLDNEAAEAFSEWVPAKQDSDLLDLMDKCDEEADKLEIAGYDMVEAHQAWADQRVGI